MQIGICTSIENGAIAAKAGFEYLELNVQGFLVPEAPDETFAPNLKVAQTAPLPVIASNAFLPGTLKSTGPDIDLDRLARYAETAFARAKQSGMRYIVYGSGGARQIPEGFSRDEAARQFVTGLRRIAPLAEKHGVSIVIEPLNSKECNFINSLAEGAAMAEAADHPNIQLLADIFHMLVDGEAPDEIVKHGRWIRHVHVAEKEGRLAPGIGGEDFSPYLRALKAIDYRGGISFESGWKDFPTQAQGCQEYFRNQVRKAGLL